MTPTTPRKFTATPVTAGINAPAPAANAPAPGATRGAGGAGGAKPIRKKPMLALVAVAGVLLLAVGAWAVWKIKNPAPPSTFATTPELASWVLSPERFDKMPYDEKKLMLGAMDSRDDDLELEKLWRERKFNETQMGVLREAAWLGKYVGRMEDYFALPMGQQRTDYIKEVVDKIQDIGQPPPPKPPTPEEKLPKRDKKWGRKQIESWPVAVQDQWKEFDKAIEAEEDRRKKEAKAAKKAAEAAKAAEKPADVKPAP